MEDLQEEIQKLVDDGGRIDEDQANMVKVAACFLAANAVKQARNKRLRNDRRKKSVWVMAVAHEHRKIWRVPEVDEARRTGLAM